MVDFELFRSRHNPSHYVAIEAVSFHPNAIAVRESQNLEPLQRIVDDGSPVLGFDRRHAQVAVAAQGFYAFVLIVEPRDHIE